VLEVLLEIQWERGCDGDWFARSRAGESDAVSVQKETAQVAGRRAIEFVAGYRMTDAGKMHANLVRAARSDFHFQVACVFEPLQNFVLGYGVAACRGFCGHADAANRVASDGLGDFAAICFHAAIYQSEIDLFYFAAGKLFGQMAVGCVRFGHQDHSAGKPVEPMNDSGAQIAGNFRELSKAMHQRIYQGARMASGARVYHHAGGFVDGDDVRVLIEDFKRDIFGDGAEWRELGRFQLNLIRAFQQVRRLRAGAVHLYTPLSDPRLQPRPAVLRKAIVQELVQAFARVCASDV